MGRFFTYNFHLKDMTEIKRSDYFKVGSYALDDSHFDNIEEIFNYNYLIKRRYEDEYYGPEYYGPYTLEEINNLVEIVGRKYTPKELISYFYNLYSNKDHLLAEIVQLSLLVKDAENYNSSNSDNPIEYITFN